MPRDSLLERFKSILYLADILRSCATRTTTTQLLWRLRLSVSTKMSQSLDNTGGASRKRFVVVNTPKRDSKTYQMRRWFNNPLLSDVTIVFGSRSIPGHKVILAQGSEYFRKMFTSSSQVWCRLEHVRGFADIC